MPQKEINDGELSPNAVRARIGLSPIVAGPDDGLLAAIEEAARALNAAVQNAVDAGIHIHLTTRDIGGSLPWSPWSAGVGTFIMEVRPSRAMKAVEIKK